MIKPWLPTGTDLSVTNTIKSLRSQQGFTQGDIAKITGIPLSKIVAFESMSQPIDPESLLLISRALGVPINELFCIKYDDFAHDTEMLQIMRRIHKLTDDDRDLISRLITRMGH